MKNICALVVLLAILCPLSFAEDTIIREVKGLGPTRDDAIKNALTQAVAQARGVRVGSGDYSFDYRSASADIDRSEDAGKSVEFDAVSVQTAGTLLKTDIEGLVKTYEVLDEKKLDDNTWQVTLKVWVYDHLPVDASSRLRLAVMPIRTTVGSYIFAGLVMPAEQLADRLSQKLATALTQTNKFAVIDREYIAEYMHEQKILGFHSSSLEEQARIGEVLGADYMLVGTVTEAELRIKQTATGAIAHTFKEYDADIGFDYRLIVAPSRQVKLSDSVRMHLETPDVKKLVTEWEPSDLDYDELVDNLIAKVALEVVNTLSDRLFPPRIAAVMPDGRVIIDQGGDRFVQGTLLEVFAPGQEITDSDTKESLGSTEILIATVRIDNVTPTMSYATLVSGDAKRLSKGLLCRPKPTALMENPGAKSTVERTPEGGVKLPFD